MRQRAGRSLWILICFENFSRHKDTAMDELYEKQSRAIDPEERRRYLRAFEKRLCDEESITS